MYPPQCAFALAFSLAFPLALDLVLALPIVSDGPLGGDGHKLPIICPFKRPLGQIKEEFSNDVAPIREHQNRPVKLSSPQHNH